MEPPVQFDFLIENHYLESDIISLLDKYGLTAEKTLQVEYTLAIAKPEFKQEEKIDDWASKLLAGQDHQLYVTGYDGTVSRLQIVEGQLRRM